METVLDLDWYYSKLSRLRDGGLTGPEAKNKIMSLWVWDIHSRPILGSAKVRWINLYLIPGVLPFWDSKLRWVNAIQASLNDCLKGGRSWLVFPICRSCTDERCRGPPDEPSEASIPSYAVVVSAVVPLSLIYQFLTGNVDIGSSKAYLRSSLDFRDIYVAIVLLQIVHNQQELINYLQQQLHESRIRISQLESQHFVQAAAASHQS